MDKFIKIGFGVFAVFALIFGFWRLSQNLKLSFIEDTANTAQTEQALMDETKLKTTDSDVDGLSDWDELNTYGTSPYLKDSDSDGVSDAEEIKNSTDPNCPTGKTCGSSVLAMPGAAIDTTATTTDPATTEAATASTALTPEETAALQEQVQGFSPDEIRALLKEGGITDSDLQGATDEDLRNLLNEVLKQTATP